MQLSNWEKGKDKMLFEEQKLDQVRKEECVSRNRELLKEKIIL